MKEVLVTFAVIAGFILCVSFGGYGLSSYFSPKYAALQTKVFRESQAYNDGMARDLENLQLQYESSNDSQKAMLKAVIIHRFSVYPQDKLTPELNRFYSSLRAGN